MLGSRRLGAAFGVLVALALVLAPQAVPAQTATTVEGQLYGEDFPDPTVVRAGPLYYAFATNGRGGNVQVIRSTDLQAWTRLPDALPELPPWAQRGSTWAPSVVQRPGGWVLFFTAAHRTTGLQCIGRATAPTIDGPFRDSSPQPFVCHMDRGGSIDPSAFIDADGTPYLVYKTEGVAGREPTRLWSNRLTTDGLSLVGGPAELAVTDQPWEEPIVEGPAMVVADGSYWLLHAGNRWETAGYAIGYSRCASPLGPCVKWGGGPLLATGGIAGIAGPGSPDVVIAPDGTLLLTYHSWTAGRVGYAAGGRRTLRAVRLSVAGGRLVLGSAGAAAPAADGYRLAAADGGLFAFGADGFHGSLGDRSLNAPIVGAAATPTGRGYWLVASDGGVFAFGDAGFFGSTRAMVLNRPIVAMAATPTGFGYWLVASDGGVFAFGDAGFFGSTGAIRLNRPIVGVAAFPSGRGYWLVASDGGLFSFGHAPFLGSTGGMVLNRPIVSMMSMPWGDGYWLVASDGGVFAFGTAPFLGSTGALSLNSPIVGATASPTGRGYWFTAADGGVFAFGDAPFVGSAGDRPLRSPVVDMA